MQKGTQELKTCPGLIELPPWPFHALHSPRVHAWSYGGGAGLLLWCAPGVCPSAGATGGEPGSVGGAYGMELMEMMELTNLLNCAG